MVQTITGAGRAMMCSSGPGLLLALGIAFAGCSNGSPTAPDQIDASWDLLEYASPQSASVLSIDSDGKIDSGDQSGETDPGLLGPDTWNRLERAIRVAEFQPVSCGVWDPQTGGVRITRGGEVVGFTWTDESTLSDAQAQVAAILEEVWDQSFGPRPGELHEFFPVARLLKGHYATVTEAAEFVIRDEDALIEMLRQTLDVRHGVVVLPEVDFARNMVLAVFLGPHDDQHIDLEIGSDVYFSARGYLQIPVVRYERAESCSIPAEPGGAFDIVTVPRTSGELYFDWETTSVGCDNETEYVLGS